MRSEALESYEGVGGLGAGMREGDWVKILFPPCFLLAIKEDLRGLVEEGKEVCW